MKNRPPFLYFVILLYIFAFSCLVNGLIKNFRINLVLGIVFLFFLSINFFYRISLRQFTLIIYLFVSAFFALFSTICNSQYFVIEGVRDLFLFTFNVMLLICLLDNSFTNGILKVFQSKSRLIYLFSVILNFIIYFMLTLDDCYKDVSLWKGSYFYGVSFGPHALASVVCFIATLKLLCIRFFEKISFIHLMLFLLDYFVILQTGARAFIIPIIICIYIFIYLSRNSSSLFFLVSLLSIAILTPLSNFCDKTISVDTYGVISNVSHSYNTYSKYSLPSLYLILNSFTSGRLIIWTNDLVSFFNGNLIELLLGKGFNFAYIVNSVCSNSPIWAHSDFVSIFISSGLLGLLLYLHVLRRVFISIHYKYKILNFCLVMYAIFPAFFNGFYMYQSFVFSFMCLFVCVSSLSKKNLNLSL